MPKQTQRYRISFLTTGLARGGAEVQVLLLAKGLKQRGWTVSVESMLPPQAFTEDLAACGIPVCPLGMRRGIPDPRAALRLARRWREFRPDVVHCHMVHANLLGRLTRLLAPSPVLISTAHNIWEGPRWRDWAYRLTDPLADLTTNVSQAAFNRYVRDKLVTPRKAAFMPNGIETRRFTPDPALRLSKRNEMRWGDRFIWLAVGNLRPAKDYTNLLDSFAIHKREAGNAHLAIAGSGELLPVLQKRIRDLDIGKSVQLLGARDDVRELMQAADSFVMSSEWEGLPLVLIEASASALPIVATKVGGNGEIIAAEQTGFLVPPKNSPALAAAMTRVYQLPEACRQQLGHAARLRAEEYYGIDRILSKWENIYEQLLQVKTPHLKAGLLRSSALPQEVRQWLQH